MVSAACIWNVADRAVDVFRESMMFPVSHASRGLAETATVPVSSDLACSMCWWRRCSRGIGGSAVPGQGPGELPTSLRECMSGSGKRGNDLCW